MNKYGNPWCDQANSMGFIGAKPGSNQISLIAHLLNLAITLVRVVSCTCGWLFKTRDMEAGASRSASAIPWIE
jgi:hypothetical protein